jgi:hypothetical protein
VLRIRIRDPVLFYPGIRNRKNKDPGPGMNISDHISGSGFRIRIRIQEGINVPPKIEKIMKFHVDKCWMFAFEG